MKTSVMSMEFTLYLPHEAQKIHAVYSTMHFEKIYVPNQYEGTAKDAYAALQAAHKRTLPILTLIKQQEKPSLRNMRPTLFPQSTPCPSFPETLTSVSWQPAHMETTMQNIQIPITSQRNRFTFSVAG